ncbi:FliH/SctL family protein [Neobacillus niacini]|uniref:FliH/SctL family protein n=1 Tax=Neobacillus niacini TaxID=86668 RepID=UPI00286AC6B2|nr:FliH/SctL family protein [Neobacillus niacini]
MEPMMSYSKVFKASHLSIGNEVKVITQPFIVEKNKPNDENPLSIDDEKVYGNQLIEEAEAKAQAIIAQAEQNAHSIETVAAEKINQWWDENHLKLDEMSAEVKQQGYQEGFELGKQEGETFVLKEYNEKLAQIQHLLQQAYEEKEAIIAEAEPFLLELSFAIASQVIKQELTSYPEKFVELIKQNIHRVKEKEAITVCVHPDDFEFVQSERKHLLAVVNGETEIKIIPDHSVSPKGCMIRTAYGSVDARIDTQLEEIKKVVLEARREPERETIS